jgi:lysozyme
MRKINQDGLNILKNFEGLSLEAYDDGGGVWTIGWGHTKGVKQGQIITLEDAEKFLLDDLEDAEKAVESMVKAELNDNQFSALVCFVFNIGAGQFKTSTLLHILNDGKFGAYNVEKAAEQFDKWVFDNGKRLGGLVKRRKAEKDLYLKPMEAKC